MLSSIHPLGERARGNRWSVTISAFTAGAVLGGAAIGAVLGGLGSLVVPGPNISLLIVGALALIGGGLDLVGIPAPGPARQVNERWIGNLRGSVYGFGFGVQLGSGVSTFIVTWGVWVLLAAELLSGSAVTGAMVGGLFGLTRAVAPLAAGWIDRPSRLTRFHTALARLARPVHVGAGFAVVSIGILGLVRGV
jgi:hypothetical protein